MRKATALLVLVATYCLGCAPQYETSQFQSQKPGASYQPPTQSALVTVPASTPAPIPPKTQLQDSTTVNRKAEAIDTQKKFNDEAVVTGHGKFQTGMINDISYKMTGGAVVLSSDESLPDEEFAVWLLFAHVDSMTDELEVSFSNRDFNMRVVKDKPPVIWIGRNHHPGSDIKIRVDKNPPFASKAPWTGEEAVQIIDQLSNSSTAITQYRKWPQKVITEKRIPTDGFAEAYLLARWIAGGQVSDSLSGPQE